MNTEGTYTKRILIVGGLILLVLLVAALVFFVLRGNGATPNEDGSLSDASGRNRASDLQARELIENTQTGRNQIEIPVPREEKITEEPLPYEVQVTNPDPVIIGYAQGMPDTDTGLLGQNPVVNGQEQTFTYEQLKALKQRLIQMCRENETRPMDGIAFQNNFITILNESLGLSITPANTIGLDVVYRPQVSEVLQSIDSATCKDKDPSIPSR